MERYGYAESNWRHVRGAALCENPAIYMSLHFPMRCHQGALSQKGEQQCNAVVDYVAQLNLQYTEAGWGHVVVEVVVVVVVMVVVVVYLAALWVDGGAVWRTALHRRAPPPSSNAGEEPRFQSALSGQTSVSSRTPLLHFSRAPPRYLKKVLKRICPKYRLYFSAAANPYL